MTLPLRSSLATFLVPALAPGLLLAGLPAAQAERARPTELVLRDPVETRASHDVRRVRLYSGSAQDPAAVTVTFARKARTGDKVKVWFDLDRDRRPELLAKVVVNERLRVFRTRSWKHKSRKPVTSRPCLTAFTEGRGMLLTISPRCLDARAMRVSVTTKGRGLTGPDHAPGRRTWSPKVRFVR